MLIYFVLAIGGNGLLIDGLLPAVAPAYTVLVVIAGMILTPVQSYGIAGLAAALWVALRVSLDRGFVPAAPVPAGYFTLVLGIIVVMALLFLAFLSQLATRDLRRALSEATFDLIQANRQLEKANNLKSMFMARTSHELRTPLNSIIGFTDVTDTVRWSDQQFALFGIPREAFSGNITRVLDAIHPDERPLVEAGIARAKERNEEFRQEFRVVRSDGQTRWLAGIGRALTGASGRVARLIGVAYDITTRKEAEEALVALNATLEQRIAERTVQLTQANERWYWVARASNNGIWDWDLIYDTGYVSPRWKQLHGFAETAEPESFWEWATRIHPDDRDQVMAHLQAYLDRREPEFRREYRIQRRDGIVPLF